MNKNSRYLIIKGTTINADETLQAAVAVSDGKVSAIGRQKGFGKNVTNF
jgi:hypothetical protein